MTRPSRLGWSLAGLGPPLLIALGLSACGRGSETRGAGEWQAAVDSLGDTVVVRTLSGSVWSDTANLAVEVSIGALEGADEFILGDPRSIGVGNDGVVYVLDIQVPVLRAYTAQGEHLRDVGREGGGPGEYQGPDGLAVLPDGRVLVRDPPNARITVFGADGEYLTHWPLTGGFNTSRRLYVDTAGYSYTSTLLERNLPPWEWRFGLVRYTPRGEIVDTLAAPTWDYEPAQVTASREGSASRRPVPFTPEVSWSFSPLGYLVGGLSTDYRLYLYRTDAAVLRIERDWTPVPVQPEEAEERRRRIAQGLQRQYGSWRWNGPPVPANKPPFRDLFVSWEGNVWVLVSQEGAPTMSPAEAREEERRSGRTPLRYREPPAFDVFAPDGSYLGPVKVPPSFRVEPEPIVRGDTVWAVTRDELDVASVARFRIVHPAGR